MGIHAGDPILLSPDYRIAGVLSRYLCRSSFARLAPETKRNYTDDYCLFFDFLWGRGKAWSDATSDDLWDFEDWRTRSLRNPRRIGGARWNRGLAALGRLYEWAVRAGHVPVSPVVMRSVVGRSGDVVTVPAARAKNAKASEVHWLTPRAFRRWVDVGLRGFGADGLPSMGWSGRLQERNAAFANLLFSSGMRLTEGASLLTFEVPRVRLEGGRYYAGRLARAVTKSKRARTFYVAASVVGEIEGYAESLRARVIRRAQIKGRYERLPVRRVVTHHTGRPRRLLHWRDQDGVVGQTPLAEASVEERMSLFTEGPMGPEPLWLWLNESGLPFQPASWEGVFRSASQRCERVLSRVTAVPPSCTPHMCRHSFALVMLVVLNHVMDRRMGLSPEERRDFRLLYGDPWRMVQDLLGHAHLETTRGIYLAPVADLQLRSLLADFGSADVHAPVGEEELTAVFTARCAPSGSWASVKTSNAAWWALRPFAQFLSAYGSVPQDVDEVTVASWSAWRLSLAPRPFDYTKHVTVAGLLREDPRLAPAVREVMAQRFAWSTPGERAYGPDEFRAIRLAAPRTFRSALLRIRENTLRLDAWRSGTAGLDRAELLLGEALDVLARTGDVPQLPLKNGGMRPVYRYRAALGGTGSAHTWKRLFLSRKEAAALSVLLAAEFGLNASTICELPVPILAAGTGQETHRIYRLALEKRRRGGRGRFESHNVADTGADSPGCLVSEALEATAQARAVVQSQEPGIDRLLVWHQTTPHEGQKYPGTVRVGPFGFGTDERAAKDWAHSVGLPGGERQTATAGCADYENSPFTAAGQSCRASFLLCTACPNARVTPAHHARLAHLHQALGNLHAVVEPAVWEADWADTHARLVDLRHRLGCTATPRSAGSPTPDVTGPSTLRHERSRRWWPGTDRYGLRSDTAPTAPAEVLADRERSLLSARHCSALLVKFVCLSA